MAPLPLRPYYSNRITHVKRCGSDLLRRQSALTARATARADLAHPEIRQPLGGCPAGKMSLAALGEDGVGRCSKDASTAPSRAHPQQLSALASNDTTQRHLRTVRPSGMPKEVAASQCMIHF